MSLSKKAKLSLLAFSAFLALAISLAVPAFASGENEGGNSGNTGAYQLGLSLDKSSSAQVVADGNSSALIKVKLDVSGATVNLDNAYIRFSVPKSSHARVAVGDFETQMSHNVKTSVVGDNNVTDIVFSHLKGGDKIGFFIKVSYDAGVTPQGTPVAIKGQLLTASNEELAASDAINLTAKVSLPKLFKSVSSKSPAGKMVDGYITEALPVEFKFYIQNPIFGAARYATNLTLTDQLPTYVAKDGSVKTAKLASQSQNSWKLSSDGKTATYTKGTDFFTTYFDNYYFDSIPSLYLLFPDAKADAKVENKATATIVPYQQQPGEADFVSASSCSTVLTGDVVKPVSVSFYKSANNGVVEDVLSAKQKPQTWKIGLSYNDSRPLQNVVIVEKPAPELYIDSLTKSDGDYNAIDQIDHIEGVLSDGSTQTCDVTKKTTGWFTKTTVGMTINDAQKYSSLKIILKSDAQLPSGYFSGASFNVVTKFRNPESVSAKTNPDGFKNVAQVTANTADKTGFVDYTMTSSFKLHAFEAQYAFQVVKNTVDPYKRDLVTPGDEVSIEVIPQNNIAAGSKITGRKVVVILPDSLDLSNSPWTSPVYSDNGIKSYNVVTDYNGSGKRALVVSLPDLKNQNLTGENSGSTITDRNTVKLIFKANNFLSLDPVDVCAFYTFDGIEAATFVKPANKVWGAVETKLVDNAYGIANGADKVAPQLPRGCVQWNARPNTEVGSVSLIGKSDNTLSPYSIDIKSGQDFWLGMKVSNFDEEVQKGIVLYDVLPHKGDKNTVANQQGEYLPRGSNSDVQLVEPVKAPEGYTVYYLSEQPLQNPDEALAMSGWTDQVPADLASVKAIKVVSNEQTELKRGSTVEVSYKVKATNLAAQPKIVNTFAYKTAQRPTIVESNAAIATLPISLNFQKVFVAPDGKTEITQSTQYVKLPEEITINVYANVSGSPKKLVKSVTLTAEQGWKQSVDDLPAYQGSQPITYTYEEVQVEGWTGSNPVEKNNVITFTNTLNNVTKDIPVTKIWNDNNATDVEHPVVEVALMHGDQEVQKIKLDQTTGNEWQGVFKNIPLVADDGSEIEYRVVEVDTPQNFYSLVDGDVQDGFTVTNTYMAPEPYHVHILWHAPDGRIINNDVPEGIKLPDEVTVNVYQQPKQMMQRANLVNGPTRFKRSTPSVEKKLYKQITVTKEHNWSVDLTDLPSFVNGKAYEYSFEQLAVDGWTLDGEAVVADAGHDWTFNDIYQIPVQDISVTKVWDDQGSLGIEHPQVQVALYADGEKTDNILNLNEDNDWTDNFKALPLIHEDGTYIVYTVQEESLPKDFEAKVEGSVKDGFVITNTYHKPEAPKPEQPQQPEQPSQDKPKPQPEFTKKKKMVKKASTPVTGDVSSLFAYSTLAMGVCAAFVARKTRK